MTTDEAFQDFVQKDQGITEDIAALDVSLATVQQVRAVLRRLMPISSLSA